MGGKPQGDTEQLGHLPTSAHFIRFPVGPALNSEQLAFKERQHINFVSNHLNDFHD